MPVTQYFPVDFQQQTIIKVALTASDANHGIVELANPFGVDVFITRVIVDVTTKSTGACTINVGVDTAAGTGDDTLLDGLDVGTAVILADNLITPGTNGVAVKKWAADNYVVVEMATGAAAGLVGNIYIHVARI